MKLTIKYLNFIINEILIELINDRYYLEEVVDIVNSVEQMIFKDKKIGLLYFIFPTIVQKNFILEIFHDDLVTTL